MSENIFFGGIIFLIGLIIVINIDFLYIDLILYYEIFDNWISLDVGFIIRIFDGELSVFGCYFLLLGISFNVNEDLDFMVLLLYGKVWFDFLVIGFYFGVEVNWIGIGDV